MGMMGMGMMGGMGYGGMGYGGGMGGYGGMGYGGMGNGGYNPVRHDRRCAAAHQHGLRRQRDSATRNRRARRSDGQLSGDGGGRRQTRQRIPHVIPNPFDNTLLIQGTPQEWEQINSLLRQLDVAPRQVLIDAKIYELDLTGAFSAGVSAYLQKKDTGSSQLARAERRQRRRRCDALRGRAGAAQPRTAGGADCCREQPAQSRVISAPSIIATDSIPATMNVGQDVPVLTSQAVPAACSRAAVRFHQYGQQPQHGCDAEDSGPRQFQRRRDHGDRPDVSEPQGNTTSSINSPSFSRRSFQYAGDGAGRRHRRSRRIHRRVEGAGFHGRAGAQPDSASRSRIRIEELYQERAPNW